MTPTLRLTGRTVDLDTGAVAEGGSLRPMELRLLRYLAERPERVVARTELLTEVWGWAAGARTNTVNTTLYRLRTALEADPDHPRHLLSLPGRGVMLAGIHAGVLPRSNVRPVGEEPIGRADELAFLRGTDARLVTVTGPGGVGKTRLALEHALASTDRVGGAWLVEVAGLESEEAIVERVAAAVGLSRQDPERMGEALAMRGPMLVVLDEAEEALAPVAACARRWLEAAPALRLLVTSRVPLGIREEQRLPLLPFPLPADPRSGPAGALLLRRVRAADPTFRPEEHGEALDDVLRQLDGLPLAIELAAPHVAALGAHGVRDALRAGDPLASSSDERPDRHRSLRAMVAWSWGALPEGGRRTIRELVAFRGSFTLEAARAVAADPRLTSLLEQGLLVPVRIGAGPRYRVLETVRAIVGEPDPDAVERHLRWYLALSERCFAAGRGFIPDELPDPGEALELLHAAGRVLDRSELPGAAELLHYASLAASRGGHRREAIAMVHAALRRGVARRARVRLLHFLSTSQEWRESLTALETLSGEAAAEGLVEVAVHAELVAALRHLVTGDSDLQRASAARAVAYAREIPPGSPLAVWAEGCRAHAEGLVADDKDALPLLEHAAERLFQPDERARVRLDIGELLLTLNRGEEAVRAYAAALRDVPRPCWLRAITQVLLAHALACAGRPAEASEQLAEGLGTARHMATTVGMVLLGRSHAETLRRLGALDEAEAAARAAADVARRHGMRSYEIGLRLIHALVRADRGDADAADRLREAFEEAVAAGWPHQVGDLLAALADLEADADLPERADRALRLPRVGFEAPRVALIRAEWLRERGRALEAVPLLAEIADRALDPLRLRVRLAMAAISAEHGDDRPARALCGEPWAAADGRWTRVHRARCLVALGRTTAAALEVAPVRWSARERALRRAVAEIAG